MAAMQAVTLPPSCCTTRAGLAVSQRVHGAGNLGGRTNLHRQTMTLACRSSSHLLGSTDLGMLQVKRRVVRTAIVSTGPRCQTIDSGGNSRVDIWIGRLAMVGFVAVISTEIASGKGVLANLGVATPAPSLALALTAIVGAVTAFGVFRSASSTEE